MPAVGTCDPTSRGNLFNVEALSIMNGDVSLTIRFGWDGVSTYATGCDGPLVNGAGTGNVWALEAVNNSQTDYYAHTLGKRGQPHSFKLAAGTTQHLTSAQALSAGYASLSDVYDLTLTTTA